MQQQQTIQLHIPTPCHEDWSQMTPNQQGRHCAHCQKTVIDFTTWSDAALYEFFSKDRGRVCGRLHAAQLSRPINIPPQPHSRLYRIVVALGLTLLFVQGTTAYAQSPANRHFTTSPTTHSGSYNGTGKLTGTVLNKNKQPVIGAKVIVLQGGLVKGGAMTDFDGNYIIEPLDPGICDVEVTYTGYGKVTVTKVIVNWDTPIQPITLSGAADTVIPYKRPVNNKQPQQVIYNRTLATVITGDVSSIGNFQMRTDTATENKGGNRKMSFVQVPELPKDTAPRTDSLLEPNRKIYNREEVQKMHMR